MYHFCCLATFVSDENDCKIQRITKRYLLMKNIKNLYIKNYLKNYTGYQEMNSKKILIQNKFHLSFF